VAEDRHRGLWDGKAAPAREWNELRASYLTTVELAGRFGVTPAASRQQGVHARRRPSVSTSTRSSPPTKLDARGKREESEWCGRATLGVVDAGLVVYRLVFRFAASWAHPEAAWGIRNADPVVCGKRELCSGWGPAAARTTDPEGARLEICGETQFSPRVEAGVLLGHGPQRDYADP
jgi:hypothetical protein